MKKYTYLIFCMFFVALVIAIPELHPQTCHLDGNTLTMLAAGPAFAPLKCTSRATQFPRRDINNGDDCLV